MLRKQEIFVELSQRRDEAQECLLMYIEVVSVKELASALLDGDHEQPP